jgi:hypothetical protein
MTQNRCLSTYPILYFVKRLMKLPCCLCGPPIVARQGAVASYYYTISLFVCPPSFFRFLCGPCIIKKKVSLIFLLFFTLSIFLYFLPLSPPRTYCKYVYYTPSHA